VIASMLLRFVVALSLLIGGIRCLSLRESGRKTLLIACAAALPFELSHAILQSVMTLENMTAMNSFAENFTNALPSNRGSGPNLERTMPLIIRGSMIAGLAIQYLISLAKIVFYAFGVIYLQRQRTRAWFHQRESQCPKSQVESR
jgi:putative Ca2+/H+ antiporter (TMEM165/GDT1 family)